MDVLENYVDVVTIVQDEHIVGAWPAHVRGTGLNRWHDVSPAYLALVILTEQRIILAKPNLDFAYRARTWLDHDYGSPFLEFWASPTHSTIAVALVDIKRIWQWQPRFSAPPMLQCVRGEYTIAFVENSRPWATAISRESLDARWNLIEAARADALKRFAAARVEPPRRGNAQAHTP
jgi:hypothetical protein